MLVSGIVEIGFTRRYLATFTWNRTDSIIDTEPNSRDSPEGSPPDSR